MRILNFTITSVLLAVGCTVPAMADEIALNGSSNKLYFCSPAGGTTIAVAATQFTTVSNCSGETDGTVSGSGVFQSPNGTSAFTGTYTLGFSTPPLIVGPLGSFGQFPANSATSSFSFVGDGGLGTVTGIITWNFIVDHTPKPRFDGNLMVSTVSGTNAAFLTDFPVNGAAGIDFTMNDIGRLFDSLTGVGDGAQASATISSGEVDVAPEVSSVLLLGTGMLLAGTFVRYRRRKQA